MIILSKLAGVRRIIKDRSQREGESVSAVANRRAKVHRTLFAVITSAISATWVGPFIAAAWLSTVLVYELLALPWYMRKFINPLGKARREEARQRSALITFGGSILFAIGWVPSWIIGGNEASYFAALWLACALMQASVYNAKDSLGFYAWVAPVVVPACVVPFFIETSLLIPFVCLLATARIMFTTHISQQDRSALFATMADDRSKRQEAEAASRAKTQFLATMSHELRTPLNAVIGYAEILEEDLGAREMESEAGDAARIRRAARSLLGLINEVLDFSKIESGRLELAPTPTDIPALLQDVVATTAHLAAANSNIVDVQIAPSLTMIELDGQRLRQCVLNLVSNACKFTSNGRISIVATLEADRAGEHLQISVADTGQGITPADQARLFQPFVQADNSATRKQDGTGLGLVITRRLARLMGGDVEMESIVGVGSRFTLRVTALRASDVLQMMSGTAPLVLVIEDEAADRDIARRAIAHLPVRVTCAENAEQGLEIAKREAPALILLDIQLPNQSGWDLLETLKSNPALRAIPVVVHSISDDRATSMTMGADDHLIKPVARERLVAAVTKYALAARADAAKAAQVAA